MHDTTEHEGRREYVPEDEELTTMTTRWSEKAGEVEDVGIDRDGHRPESMKKASICSISGLPARVR